MTLCERLASAAGRMAESVGFGYRLVLDNSAWARVIGGQLPNGGQGRWEAAVRAEEILICEPFRLEALYSARSQRDYEEIAADLNGFEQVSSHGLLGQALAAQAELAQDRQVSHRVKIVDLIVAAAAAAIGAGVLHYDHDFDIIATHTSLDFRSEWIAPRGTL